MAIAMCRPEGSLWRIGNGAALGSTLPPGGQRKSAEAAEGYQGFMNFRVLEYIRGVLVIVPSL